VHSGLLCFYTVRSKPLFHSVARNGLCSKDVLFFCGVGVECIYLFINYVNVRHLMVTVVLAIDITNEVGKYFHVSTIFLDHTVVRLVPEMPLTAIVR
jgi:hypothetical protein